VRGLIERIEVHAVAGGGMEIEVVGELAAMVRLGTTAPAARVPAGEPGLGLFARSVKVVAGNRSHHDLRRIEALAAQVNVVAGERNHHDLLFRAAA
jgi:hypothetical protein